MGASWYLINFAFWALVGNRTRDLVFTKDALCHLSYKGKYYDGQAKDLPAGKHTPCPAKATPWGEGIDLANGKLLWDTNQSYLGDFRTKILP